MRMATSIENLEYRPRGGYLLAPRVPRGLAAAVEGLTREVLRHHPEDIYVFAAHHFEKLLELREQYGISENVQPSVDYGLHLRRGLRQEARRYSFQKGTTSRRTATKHLAEKSGWSLNETAKVLERHRSIFGDDGKRISTEDVRALANEKIRRTVVDANGNHERRSDRSSNSQKMSDSRGRPRSRSSSKDKQAKVEPSAGKVEARADQRSTIPKIISHVSTLPNRSTGVLTKDIKYELRRNRLGGSNGKEGRERGSSLRRDEKRAAERNRERDRDQSGAGKEPKEASSISKRTLRRPLEKAGKVETDAESEQRSKRRDAVECGTLGRGRSRDRKSEARPKDVVESSSDGKDSSRALSMDRVRDYVVHTFATTQSLEELQSPKYVEKVQEVIDKTAPIIKEKVDELKNAAFRRSRRSAEKRSSNGLSTSEGSAESGAGKNEIQWRDERTHKQESETGQEESRLDEQEEMPCSESAISGTRSDVSEGKSNGQNILEDISSTAHGKAQILRRSSMSKDIQKINGDSYERDSNGSETIDRTDGSRGSNGKVSLPAVRPPSSKSSRSVSKNGLDNLVLPPIPPEALKVSKKKDDLTLPLLSPVAANKVFVDSDSEATAAPSISTESADVVDKSRENEDVLSQTLDEETDRNLQPQNSSELMPSEDQLIIDDTRRSEDKDVPPGGTAEDKDSEESDNDAFDNINYPDQEIVLLEEICAPKEILVDEVFKDSLNVTPEVVDVSPRPDSLEPEDIECKEDIADETKKDVLLTDKLIELETAERNLEKAFESKRVEETTEKEGLGLTDKLIEVETAERNLEKALESQEMEESTEKENVVEEDGLANKLIELETAERDLAKAFEIQKMGESTNKENIIKEDGLADKLIELETAERDLEKAFEIQTVGESSDKENIIEKDDLVDKLIELETAEKNLEKALEGEKAGESIEESQEVEKQLTPNSEGSSRTSSKGEDANACIKSKLQELEETEKRIEGILASEIVKEQRTPKNMEFEDSRDAAGMKVIPTGSTNDEVDGTEKEYLVGGHDSKEHIIEESIMEKASSEVEEGATNVASESNGTPRDTPTTRTYQGDETHTPESGRRISRESEDAEAEVSRELISVSMKKDDFEDGRSLNSTPKEIPYSYILTEGSPCEIPESVTTVIIPDRPVCTPDFDIAEADVASDRQSETINEESQKIVAITEVVEEDGSSSEEEDLNKQDLRGFKFKSPMEAFGEYIRPEAVECSTVDIDFIRGIKAGHDVMVSRQDLDRIREEEEEGEDTAVQAEVPGAIAEDSRVGSLGVVMLEDISEKEEKESADTKAIPEHETSTDVGVDVGSSRIGRSSIESSPDDRRFREDSDSNEAKETSIADDAAVQSDPVNNVENSFDAEESTEARSTESTNEVKETTITDRSSESLSLDPARPIVPELNLDSLQDITLSSFKVTDNEDADETGKRESDVTRESDEMLSFTDSLTSDEKMTLEGRRTVVGLKDVEGIVDPDREEPANESFHPDETEPGAVVDVEEVIERQSWPLSGSVQSMDLAESSVDPEEQGKDSERENIEQDDPILPKSPPVDTVKMKKIKSDDSLEEEIAKELIEIDRSENARIENQQAEDQNNASTTREESREENTPDFIIQEKKDDDDIEIGSQDSTNKQSVDDHTKTDRKDEEEVITERSDAHSVRSDKRSDVEVDSVENVDAQDAEKDAQCTGEVAAIENENKIESDVTVPEPNVGDPIEHSSSDSDEKRDPADLAKDSEQTSAEEEKPTDTPKSSNDKEEEETFVKRTSGELKILTSQLSEGSEVEVSEVSGHSLEADLHERKDDPINESDVKTSPNDSPDDHLGNEMTNDTDPPIESKSSSRAEQKSLDDVTDDEPRTPVADESVASSDGDAEKESIDVASSQEGQPLLEQMPVESEEQSNGDDHAIGTSAIESTDGAIVRGTESDGSSNEKRECHVYVPEVTQREDDSISGSSSTFQSAVTKIQAGVRGFLTRRRLRSDQQRSSTLDSVPSIQESVAVEASIPTLPAAVTTLVPEASEVAVELAEQQDALNITNQESQLRESKARQRLRREDAVLKTTLSLENAFTTSGLQHTGEFHDCLPLPVLDTVERAKRMFLDNLQRKPSDEGTSSSATSSRNLSEETEDGQTDQEGSTIEKETEEKASTGDQESNDEDGAIGDDQFKVKRGSGSDSGDCNGKTGIKVQPTLPRIPIHLMSDPISAARTGMDQIVDLLVMQLVKDDPTLQKSYLNFITSVEDMENAHMNNQSGMADRLYVPGFHPATAKGVNEDFEKDTDDLSSDGRNTSLREPLALPGTPKGVVIEEITSLEETNVDTKDWKMISNKESSKSGEEFEGLHEEQEKDETLTVAASKEVKNDSQDSTHDDENEKKGSTAEKNMTERSSDSTGDENVEKSSVPTEDDNHAINDPSLDSPSSVRDKVVKAESSSNVPADEDVTKKSLIGSGSVSSIEAEHSTQDSSVVAGDENVAKGSSFSNDDEHVKTSVLASTSEGAEPKDQLLLSDRKCDQDSAVIPEEESMRKGSTVSSEGVESAVDTSAQFAEYHSEDVSEPSEARVEGDLTQEIPEKPNDDVQESNVQPEEDTKEESMDVEFSSMSLPLPSNDEDAPLAIHGESVDRGSDFEGNQSMGKSLRSSNLSQESQVNADGLSSPVTMMQLAPAASVDIPEYSEEKPGTPSSSRHTTPNTSETRLPDVSKDLPEKQ